MAIKLLAIDMDGTCLNSRNKISDETLYSLRQARSQGIELLPTTGRTLTCIPYQLQQSGLFRYVITSNGAVLTDVETGETIFNALMPLEKAMDMMCKCKGAGLGMTAHIGHEYLVQGKPLAVMGRFQYGKDASNSQTVQSILSYAEEKQQDVEELQFFFFNQKARRRTELALEQEKDLAATYSGFYVEIYSQNATKGKALAAAAKYLAIDRSEIACIGDGENDLPMFQEAGTRFAMGNAIPALKAAADKVVSSNDQNGVAEAIQALLT